MEGFKDVLAAETGKAGKEKVHPACVYVNEKQLPAIKGWKLGETYSLKVRMRSKTLSDGEEGLDSAEFEVLGAAGDDNSKDTAADKESATEDKKEDYDESGSDE